MENKKYKLLAVDIDGTLLNNKKELTEENKKYIDLAIENGAIFAISTGRAYVTAKRYFEMFGQNIPLILYNGSLVCMSRTEEVIFNVLMPNEIVNQVIEILENQDITYCFWADDKVYFNKFDSHMEYYKKSTGCSPILYKKDMQKVENVVKFVCFDTPEVLQNLQENILNIVDGINYFKSMPTFLEIVPVGIDKARAVEKLSERFNISKEDVIAIGDGENDISMIRWAGLGVAMENANVNVKSNADIITKSNEDSGVAEVIKKYVL